MELEQVQQAVLAVQVFVLAQLAFELVRLVLYLHFCHYLIEQHQHDPLLQKLK